jgi:hypothetical protein
VKPVRGWDRASFEFHTRPTRVPRRLRQRDLLLPAHHSVLRLLGACAISGACISLLYVWTPLMVVAIMLDNPLKPWFWIGVVTAALFACVVLFALSLRQMARYREYAPEV